MVWFSNRVRAPFHPHQTTRRFNVKRFLFISAVYGLLSFTVCYSEAQVPPEEHLRSVSGCWGGADKKPEWNMILQQQLYNNTQAQVEAGADSPHAFQKNSSIKWSRTVVRFNRVSGRQTPWWENHLILQFSPGWDGITKVSQLKPLVLNWCWALWVRQLDKDQCVPAWWGEGGAIRQFHNLDWIDTGLWPHMTIKTIPVISFLRHLQRWLTEQTD